MSYYQKNFPSISVAVFLLFIGTAHILAPPEYSWKQHTISQLAAQGYAFRGVMQAGFVCFGGLLGLGIFLKALRGHLKMAIDGPVLVYGMAVLVSGIFCTTPFLEGTSFAPSESKVHAITTIVAGFSFALAILMKGVLEPVAWKKITHLAYLLFVLGCSLLLVLADHNMGFIQRILYLGSFSWLVFYYNGGEGSLRNTPLS